MTMLFLAAPAPAFTEYSNPVDSHARPNVLGVQTLTGVAVLFAMYHTPDCNPNHASLLVCEITEENRDVVPNDVNGAVVQPAYVPLE